MPTATFQIAAGITSSGAGVITFYTVPANSVVIVKSILLSQQSDDTVAASVNVSAKPAGSGITVAFFENDSVTYHQPFYWTGWVVLQATDQLFAQFANRFNYVISGAMLPVP